MERSTCCSSASSLYATFTAGLLACFPAPWPHHIPPRLAWDSFPPAVPCNVAVVVVDYTRPRPSALSTPYRTAARAQRESGSTLDPAALRCSARCFFSRRLVSEIYATHALLVRECARISSPSHLPALRMRGVADAEPFLVSGMQGKVPSSSSLSFRFFLVSCSRGTIKENSASESMSGGGQTTTSSP